MLELVSVPSRGTTFPNKAQSANAYSFETFPSPLGELHFQIKPEQVTGLDIYCFRPLSGNYISKLPLLSSDRLRSITGFRPLSGNYISKLLKKYQC